MNEHNNTIILVRYKDTDRGVRGRLYLRDHTLETLELPWRNNAREISCIPLGEYTCHDYHSARFGKTIALGVTGRTGILLHTGNTIADSRGCILLGSTVSESGIAGSRKAMDLFRSYLPLQSRTFIVARSY